MTKWFLTQWILDHWHEIIVLLGISFILDLLLMIDVGISTTYTREESMKRTRKCSIAAIVIGVPMMLMIILQYMSF